MVTVQNIWFGWKKVARRISTIQSKFLLFIFYFSLLLPFGVILTFFRDGLGAKGKLKSNWKKKLQDKHLFAGLREQF